MSAVPPMGVIAPNHRNPVNGIRYNVPAKIPIPIKFRSKLALENDTFDNAPPFQKLLNLRWRPLI